MTQPGESLGETFPEGNNKPEKDETQAAPPLEQTTDSSPEALETGEKPEPDATPTLAEAAEKVVFTGAEVASVMATVEELEAGEYTPDQYEELLRLYDETMEHIEEGEVVPGRIVAIEENEVIIDVGFKSEGAIAIDEFEDVSALQVGDEIDVFLESIEDQDGQVVISKLKADFLRVWDKIKDAYEDGTPVEGRLLRRIKGGLVVDLFGVDAFLPGSQVGLKQEPNLDALLGQTFLFKIIKLNKSRRNIVVSRRVVLEEEREKKKQAILAELQKGQIREGIVKNITDFGAFIDLGGIDGLLHITDMSWGRVGHPSELVNLNDKIQVKILEVDIERERISLGLKQLTPYPWENVEEKYPVDSRVHGRVVSITDYGAFVELEKGIEGLVHISEMSWTKHITHPSKVVAINDIVEAVVLKVDKEGEKISLGLKQTEPDPWLTLDERHPVDTRIQGKVRNLTNFGAFVEIEEGIDGLVHISDMSWTKRIRHPNELLKKGDMVEVVILNIDKGKRRISLGLKQVKPDPWDQLGQTYGVDTETEGRIVRLLERGVVVELPGEVEGFVPISQLGHPNIKRPADAFSEGDSLPLKVIDFDPQNHRIVLSVKAYFRSREQADIAEYVKSHPVERAKVGDVIAAEKLGRRGAGKPPNRDKGSSETTD